MQDFDYKDNYLEKWVTNPEGANGAALEHHGFAHLDCPLKAMRESGHYILAKFLNEEKTKIAITAFKVRSLLRANNLVFHDLLSGS